MRKDNKLFTIKQQLFVFFQTAFHSCAIQKLGSEVRMADLGFILLRILRPWSSQSDFTNACIEKTTSDKGKTSNLIETLTAESRNFMS